MRAILVVESDAETRMWVGEVLGRAGHRVVAVESAVEGIRRLAWALPALVIVDAWLPDSDAQRFVMTVHSWNSRREIPVVVLMGPGVNVRIQGAAAVLKIPTSRDALLRTLDTQFQRLGERHETVE